MSEEETETQYRGYFNNQLTPVGYYGKMKYPRTVYSDLTENLVRVMLKRANKMDYQNVVVIEGRTGSGKSTLAVKLARMIDPKFDLDNDYIYSIDDLVAKLEKAKTNIKGICPVSLMDEGTVILSGKNSLRKEDKQLIVLLQTMRSLNWTTIICVPKFSDLNAAIREQLVDYRIQCPDKPLIPFMIAENKDGVKVKYRMSARGFYEVYIPKYPKFSEHSDIYWRWIGSGIYGDLPKDIKEQYRRVKLDHQLSWLAKFNEEQNKRIKKESDQ